jgi:hypothetical protein
MVLKATSEQGRRLNIRKATLRQWRFEFARHLRTLGVPANATERAVRGEVRTTRKDGIYRATLRGESTYMRERARAFVRGVPPAIMHVDPGKATLLDTRENVQRAWRTASEILTREKQPGLAAEVRRFAEQMPPPTTERDQLARTLVERTRPPRVLEGPSR